MLPIPATSRCQHGTRSWYNKGCRCELCTVANRQYSMALDRLHGVQPLKRAEHGDRNATLYGNHGCRCEPCKAAGTAKHRRWQEGAIKRLPEADVAHGVTSTYNNWRCRCDPCRQAHSETLKQRRARR